MPQQTLANWKSRPVFISSTFKDMGEEREYLNNFIFPELEERLRERRHFIEPIDLRWGVETASVDEEHEKEMLVLKVCLGEIERSRPFLIALMGDRYGWVPPEERMKQAQQEAGYSSPINKKSITALEIEYGVLNSADQRKRSYFYMRETLPYDKMSEDTAAIYSDAKAGNLDAAKRLIELKETIRQNPDLKDRVRNYTADWDENNQKVTHLEAFGKMVLEDLWNDLKEETEKFLQETQTWQDQERALLDEFIENRTRTFTGREQVLQEIKDFALTPDDENTFKALCLTGEAGSGKSAVFAQTWQNLQKEDVIVLANAAGTGASSSDVNAILERWIEEICHFLQTPNPLPEKPSPVDIDQYFRTLLFTAGEKKRVVVLLDALDQLEATNRGLYMTWLPVSWPANTRLLCTSIPGQQTQSMLEKDYVTEKELPVLHEQDAEVMAIAICQKYHRELSKKVLQTLLDKKKDDGQAACNNPLWLSIAMEELNKLDGDALALADKTYKGTPEENLLQLLLDTVVEMPPTPETLYPWVFKRAEKLFGTAYTQTILNLIAISRKGLREKDLEVLVSKQTNTKWNKLTFASFKRQFRGQLITKGILSLYVFFHKQMKEAVKKYTRNNISTLHQEIGNYLRSLPINDLMRNEIMHHLLERGDQKELARYYGEKLPDDEYYEAGQILSNYIIAKNDSSTKSKIDLILNWINYSDERLNLINNFLLGSILTGWLEKDREYFYERLSEQIEKLNNPYYTHGIKEYYSRTLSICYAKLGLIKDNLGKNESAYHFFLKSIKLRESGLNVDLFEKNLLIRELAYVYQQFANNCQTLGKSSEAFKFQTKSFEIFKRLFDENSNDIKYQMDMSNSFQALSSLNYFQGNLINAKEFANEAKQLLENLYNQDFQDTYVKDKLCGIYLELGDIEAYLGVVDKARNFYQSALDINEELLKYNPNSLTLKRNLGLLLMKIGDNCTAKKETKEAFTFYLKSQKLRCNLAIIDPGSTAYLWDISTIKKKIGNNLKEQKQFQGAIDILNESLSIDNKLLSVEPTNNRFRRNIYETYKLLGDTEQSQGHFIKAIEKYIHAKEIIQNLSNKNPDYNLYKFDLSEILKKIGDVYFKQNLLKDAKVSYFASSQVASAILLIEQNNPKWIFSFYFTFCKLAEILEKEEKFDQAYDHYVMALKSTELLLSIEENNQENYNKLIAMNHRLASLSQRMGDQVLATDYWRKCKLIIEKLIEQGNQLNSEIQGLYSLLLDYFNSSPQNGSSNNSAIQSHKDFENSNNSSYQTVHQGLDKLERVKEKIRQDEFNEALDILYEIKEVNDSHKNAIGVCYLKLGLYKKAIKYFLEITREGIFGWKDTAKIEYKKNLLVTFLLIKNIDAYQTALKDMEINEIMNEGVQKIINAFKKWQEEIKEEVAKVSFFKRSKQKVELEKNKPIVFDFEIGELDF